MKKAISVVLNNFTNDSRVLKENISLQKAGYDVRVIALLKDGLKEFEVIQGIPVYRVKLKSKSWYKNKFIQLIKYLEFVYRVVKLYKYEDIIHCNDLDTLSIGVIIKKLYRKDVKIIYDAHEYETERNGINGFNKYLLRITEKILIKYVDKVITVSDSIANEYAKIYNIEKPALVLNTPQYNDIKKEDIFRKTLGIGKDKTIFLYQGGFTKGRGIEILLDTFKNIKNKNLVIVFMGYGHLEEVIKKMSKKYENIYFHKAVSPNNLLKYTSSADFGISTIEDTCLSYRYCLPNKIFEYLMAEIPVIVSNLYEIKKLVEKNSIGVVAKENTPNGLREAILKAQKLDKNQLIDNIKKVKNIYNWEEQEKALLKVYRSLYK